jgi:hypothetical protein
MLLKGNYKCVTLNCFYKEIIRIAVFCFPLVTEMTSYVTLDFASAIWIIFNVFGGSTL